MGSPSYTYGSTKGTEWENTGLELENYKPYSPRGLQSVSSHRPLSTDTYNPQTMRHDKLSQQLELLLLLTENRQLTVDHLCRKLGLQKRNLYYYLEFFKGADFRVEKRNGIYSIPRDSKFISRLADIVKFSEDEVVMIKRLLDETDDKNIVIQGLRRKLSRFYDFDIIADDELRRVQAHNASQLYEAIKFQRMVTIVGYSSPHSQTVTDRIVEPYLFLNGNRDIRAYELRSGMNKTFRVSRMRDVEILDTEWLHKTEHKPLHTDVFNFASETLTLVTLRLDQLSYNVMTEEYPRAESDITADGDNHWTYRAYVCSMIGIGRFVLGLYDHIQIVDSPELQAYVREKLDHFARLSSDGQ